MISGLRYMVKELSGRFLSLAGRSINARQIWTHSQIGGYLAASSRPAAGPRHQFSRTGAFARRGGPAGGAPISQDVPLVVPVVDPVPLPIEPAFSWYPLGFKEVGLTKLGVPLTECLSKPSPCQVGSVYSVGAQGLLGIASPKNAPLEEKAL